MTLEARVELSRALPEPLPNIEKMAAAAILASMDGIALLDGDGHFVYLNQAHATIYGFDSPAELIHKSWEILYRDAELERFRREIMPQFAREGSWRGEATGTRQDGSSFAQEISLNAIADGQGFICVCRDTSEQTANRAQLERTASLLRTTLDSTAEGIAVSDLDGKILLLNDQLAKILGLPPEILNGRQLQAIRLAISHLVVDPEAYLRRAEKLRTSPELESFDVIEFLDGRFVERHTVPQHCDGRIMGRVWSFRDITLARHAEAERASSLTREQELRAKAEASERRTKFVADASVLLESSLDYEGTIRTAARLAVPKLADWCAIDIWEDEKYFRRMAVAHRDPSKDVVRRKLEGVCPSLEGPPRGSFKVMKTGVAEFMESVASEHLKLIASSDEWLESIQELGVTSYMCLPLKARGRVLGALTFARSSSNERYQQYDLQLADDLARRVALAIDNARLYREAQEAIQARHEFISVASHEMRTPLTALFGYLQLARRTTEICEITSMLASAEQQCLRLVHFMSDLLDVSRISARGIKLEFEQVELNELVREILEKLGHAFDLTDYPITVRCAGPVLGTWDRLRIEQVVTNLMTNAIKYGNHKPIEIHIEQDAERARLFVIDHGIGVSEEDLTRIFQRFERAVSNRGYKGAGLGLWITRSIVEAHGGQIAVTSLLGKGSSFRVELPLKPAGASQATA